MGFAHVLLLLFQKKKCLDIRNGLIMQSKTTTRKMAVYFASCLPLLRNEVQTWVEDSTAEESHRDEASLYTTTGK